MIEERLIAVRKLREEADRLLTACVEATATGALLHVAYDPLIIERMPLGDAILIGHLSAIQ